MPESTSLTALLDQYRSVLQLVSIIGAGSGVIWFFRELFAKLDKITDNHLTHIQAATEKSASTLSSLQITLAVHDARATEIDKELQDFRAEVRSRPTECPLLKKDES